MKSWHSLLASLTIPILFQRVPTNSSCHRIQQVSLKIFRSVFCTYCVQSHSKKYTHGWFPLFLVLKSTCEYWASTLVMKENEIKCARTLFHETPSRMRLSEIFQIHQLTRELWKAVRYGEKINLEITSHPISEGWTNKQFEKVDSNRLHITTDKKLDRYNMWLFKQHTGHCCTQVKVWYYSGNINGGINCPNCGNKKPAAHLCLCPNKDRSWLFIKGVDKLKSWLERQDKTNTETHYWLPMYLYEAQRHTVIPRPGCDLTTQDSLHNK